MRHWAIAMGVLLTGGCVSSLGSGTGDDAGGEPAGDAAPMADADVAPEPSPDAATSTDGGWSADASERLASGSVRGDICGNDFDDDENGLVDDGCDCAVGTERPCWLGPEDARGVGICHDGVQHCESSGGSATWSFCEEMQTPEREILDNGFDDDCDGTIDESDGICSPSANIESGVACGNGRDDDCDTLTDCDDPDCEGEDRCSGGCDSTETVCWGGVDEDCDGRVDCEDPDCEGTRYCEEDDGGGGSDGGSGGSCPIGQTPTYRERDLGSSWGASSIRSGPGGARMPMSCEESSCADGQVQVVRVDESPICAPPPPDCPDGNYPTYVASGTWRCDPPCELIIHYGALYGGQNVCAGRPDEMCYGDQVPTFVYESESWECRPECRNAEYDQISLDGSTVCIPC